MVAAVTPAGPIPSQLGFGWSLLVSARMASTLMYVARRKKLAATSCCARRSAMCELRRLPVKSQSTNSPTCQPIPAQAGSRARRSSVARSESVRPSRAGRGTAEGARVPQRAHVMGDKPLGAF